MRVLLSYHVGLLAELNEKRDIKPRGQGLPISVKRRFLSALPFIHGLIDKLIVLFKFVGKSLSLVLRRMLPYLMCFKVSEFRMCPIKKCQKTISSHR